MSIGGVWLPSTDSRRRWERNRARVCLAPPSSTSPGPSTSSLFFCPRLNFNVNSPHGPFSPPYPHFVYTVMDALADRFKDQAIATASGSGKVKKICCSSSTPSLTTRFLAHSFLSHHLQSVQDTSVCSHLFCTQTQHTLIQSVGIPRRPNLRRHRAQMPPHPGHHRRPQPGPCRCLELGRLCPPHLRTRSRRGRQRGSWPEPLLLHKGCRVNHRSRPHLRLRQHPHKEVRCRCWLRCRSCVCTHPSFPSDTHLTQPRL